MNRPKIEAELRRLQRYIDGDRQLATATGHGGVAFEAGRTLFRHGTRALELRDRLAATEGEEGIVEEENAWVAKAAVAAFRGDVSETAIKAGGREYRGRFRTTRVVIWPGAVDASLVPVGALVETKGR